MKEPIDRMPNIKGVKTLYEGHSPTFNNKKDKRNKHMYFKQFFDDKLAQYA